MPRISPPGKGLVYPIDDRLWTFILFITRRVGVAIALLTDLCLEVDCSYFDIFILLDPQLHAALKHALSHISNCRFTSTQLYETTQQLAWNHGADPSIVLSLLQSLPIAPSYGKTGVCTSCAYTFSAKGPMTYKKQNRSRLKPHRNPYREAQARQRKAANLVRQRVLREERAKAMGDPVHSIETPFIKSLSTGHMSSESSQGQKEERNYFLKDGELSDSLEYSKNLSAPYITPAKRKTAATNADAPEPNIEERLEEHKEDHENAVRALSIITSLKTGSSKDLTRLNIQRCISAFGRQSTDEILPPKPSSIYNNTPPVSKLRAGPDTGSSEVQAAILTTRINTLARNLHNKDKHSKRALRLLVHKRQKMLSYLRRKERAGPRWQNLVETLGIQDAMWKSEITLR